MTHAGVRAKSIPLLIAIVLALPGLTLAQDPTKNRQPNPLEDPSYRECVGTCLYDQANQQITLMIHYSQELFARLTVAAENLRTNTDVANSTTTLSENLRGYLNNPQARPSTSELLEAYDRYVEIHKLSLLKARSAILQNQDAAAKYQSGGPDQDSKAFAKTTQQKDPPKKPLIPYLPTYADLEDSYKKMKPEKRPDFKAWAKNLLVEPQKEDFYVYEVQKLPPDAKYPNGREIMSVKKDSNGTPVVDLKAWQKAVANYKSGNKSATRDAATLRFDKEKESVSKSRVKYFDATDPLNKNFGMTDAQKEAYGATRKVFIETVLPNMKKGKVVLNSSVNFPGKKPANSAPTPGQSATPTPTQTPASYKPYMYTILDDPRKDNIEQEADLRVVGSEDYLNDNINQVYQVSDPKPNPQPADDIFEPKPKRAP